MGDGSAFVRFFYEAFKKKAGEDPAGQVVEADDFFNIPLGAFVIPRAEFAAHQKGAGDKFSDKNKNCVKKTAHKEMALFYNMAYGGEESGHAVYGKHPDGSVSV